MPQINDSMKNLCKIAVLLENLDDDSQGDRANILVNSFKVLSDQKVAAVPFRNQVWRAHMKCLVL
jgi:hypothetical protein